MAPTRRAVMETVGTLALLLAGCGGSGGGGDSDAPIAFVASTGSGGGSPAFTSVSFSLAINLTGGTQVFDGLPVTPADEGSVFEEDGSNDPDFPGLAGHLTNGIDQDLSSQINFGGGASGFDGKESARLVGLWGDVPSPDLAGYTVTRIRLFIDQLSLTPAAGGETDFSFSVRFVIYGRRN